jgi:hypothetical protein
MQASVDVTIRLGQLIDSVSDVVAVVVGNVAGTVVNVVVVVVFVVLSMSILIMMSSNVVVVQSIDQHGRIRIVMVMGVTVDILSSSSRLLSTSSFHCLYSGGASRGRLVAATGWHDVSFRWFVQEMMMMDVIVCLTGVVTVVVSSVVLSLPPLLQFNHGWIASSDAF